MFNVKYCADCWLQLGCRAKFADPMHAMCITTANLDRIL